MTRISLFICIISKITIQCYMIISYQTLQAKSFYCDLGKIKLLYLDKYIYFTNAIEIRYYCDTNSIMHDKNAFRRYVRNSSGQVKWLPDSLFLFHFTKCFIYTSMILFLFFSICVCLIMHMLKHFCSG